MSDASRPSTNRVTGTLVERHVWILFLVLGIYACVLGASDLWLGGAMFAGGEAVLFQSFTGTTWEELKASDPNVANLIDHEARAAARNLLIFGILASTVALTGFRRGERWAWYAMWTWPLLGALAVLQLATEPRLPGYGTPVPIISGSAILVLSTSALGLTYRKFFGRRKSEDARTGSLGKA